MSMDVVEDGEYTIAEPLVTIQLADGREEKLTMTQKWPIRVARPTAKRFPASQPLVTGPAYPGYPVPAGKRRHRRDPGRVRDR